MFRPPPQLLEIPPTFPIPWFLAPFLSLPWMNDASKSSVTFRTHLWGWVPQKAQGSIPTARSAVGECNSVSNLQSPLCAGVTPSVSPPCEPRSVWRSVRMQRPLLIPGLRKSCCNYSCNTSNTSSRRARPWPNLTSSLLVPIVCILSRMPGECVGSFGRTQG